MSHQRVLDALTDLGLERTVIRHHQTSSLAEAARVRGVTPRDIVKTLVVRRDDHTYLFVLIPGDRKIIWPKLRALLGVNRISMPDADEAFEATGFHRGTITPFGSTHPWPVIADASITGRRITMGAGESGVTIALNADSAIRALNATVADVSELL